MIAEKSKQAQLLLQAIDAQLVRSCAVSPRAATNAVARSGSSAEHRGLAAG